ncbi:hypothetical protein ACFXGT_30870 [Streptomyces sp. NPDC059352]|uniref:hypothetical protein n=1 Tax=Streptomyces sp. NPDC059352 TaxID=3346810 RepID=UPI003697BFB8
MATHIRRRLVAGIVGTFVALAGATTIAFAAGATPASVSSSAAEEVPPHSVENFEYPDAAQILSEEGILLKKGDGRVLLAECDNSKNQIRILTVKDESVGRKDMYCFEARAGSGYLTLELPRVFALETTDHSISADLTSDGETTTVNVPKNDFATVGEGDIPSGAKRSTLVEIRITG